MVETIEITELLKQAAAAGDSNVTIDALGNLVLTGEPEGMSRGDTLEVLTSNDEVVSIPPSVVVDVYLFDAGIPVRQHEPVLSLDADNKITGVSVTGSLIDDIILIYYYTSVSEIVGVNSYELTDDDIKNGTPTPGLVSGEQLGKINSTMNPALWTHTEPFRKVITVGTGNGNVLQDLAIHPVTGELVVTQNTVEDVLVNTFSQGTGPSTSSRTYANTGHGQGLSIEVDGSGDTFWWYGSSDAVGNVIHRVDPTTDTVVVYPVDFSLSLAGTYSGNITPKLDTTGQTMAIRATRVEDEFDYVFLYDFADIKTASTTAVAFSTFQISPEQDTVTQFFQGLALTGDTVTVLTGNTDLASDQLLYTYDYSGNVIHKNLMSLGSEYASSEGAKQEVEGLAYLPHGSGEQTLITSVMTGTTGVNIKRLYAIKSGDTNSKKIGFGLETVKATASYNGATWDVVADTFRQDCESIGNTTPSGGEGLTFNLAFPVVGSRLAVASGDRTFVSRGLVPGMVAPTGLTTEVEVRIYDLLTPSATPAADRIPANSVRLVTGSEVSIDIEYEYPFNITQIA